MKHNQLGGHIGADANFTMATHTGHSKANAKHTDAQPEVGKPGFMEVLDERTGVVVSWPSYTDAA